MTIYQYPDAETLATAPIFVIVPLFIIGICIYALIINREKIKKTANLLPIMIPFFVGIIFAIGMFPMCFRVFHLHDLSEHDRGDTLYGSLEILEEEEHWYRDDFQGYTLRIKVDETEIAPENTFSKEALDTLKKQTAVTIYYDESNGELYILKIVADLANP